MDNICPEQSQLFFKTIHMDGTYTPTTGDYSNAMVVDDVGGKYFFDTSGVYTPLGDNNI